MNLQRDTYNSGQSRSELEPILDALAEINVQLRQILQVSKSVTWELEMRLRIANCLDERELESKSQSILANMGRTEAAIGNMSHEISALLQRAKKYSV